MKRVLLLLNLVLVVNAPASFAISHIGIYRDATGQSCTLDPGYNNSVVVMHRYAWDADWIHFRVDFSNAAGSTFISFSTPYITVGSLTTDLLLAYNGSCMSGDIVVGTITAILEGGYLEVTPGDGYPVIEVDDCWFQMLPATGGRAYIGTECTLPVATEQTTWGSVKALYR